MRSLSILLLAFVISVSCTSQQPTKDKTFTLADFQENSEDLNATALKIYESLSTRQRVAQMIITSTGRLGKPYDVVVDKVKKGSVGGVIFLSGDPEVFKGQIEQLNGLSGNTPLLFSIDAEPSLFNSRLSNVPKVPKTAELESKSAVRQATRTIDSTICGIGFHQNYAPVIDLSKQNQAIGNRSFGSDSAEVVSMALEFVKQSSEDGVVSTVKHFPGHGRIAGDTHEKLVYIDGELTELSIYEPFIEAGVPSIMVGHIAIENNDRYNTDGMPATCSRTVVTDLLRKEMGFEGIIITDAMNMGALTSIDNSGLLAAKAGCDLLLMPPNEEAVLEVIMKESQMDKDFGKQIEESVLRIIKLKLCLGLQFKG